MHQTLSTNQSNVVTWAQRVAADPKTIYLDTETTGLGNTAEIVEVAAVDTTGRVLLDTLVKPREQIPADVTRIHGITNAMVMDAIGWEAVAPIIELLLASASNVVIYNADFDARIMEQCNARSRLSRFRANWQCAMQQYAAFAGRTHNRYGGYRWHKLTDAAATFGHREAVQHRALADTRLCRAVVLGMAGLDAGVRP